MLAQLRHSYGTDPHLAWMISSNGLNARSAILPIVCGVLLRDKMDLCNPPCMRMFHFSRPLSSITLFTCMSWPERYLAKRQCK